MTSVVMSRGNSISIAAMNVRQLLALEGRHALVTGGSRGLGLQIAEALGEMGAKVAITARKQQELDEAIAHLKRAGIDAHAYACDLGKREAIVPMADQGLPRCGGGGKPVNKPGPPCGAAAAENTP